MGNKRSCQKQLRVQMKYVPAPDAKQRLSRVVNILLKATAKSTTAGEEKLPRHTPREEGLTSGKLSEVVKGQQNV